MNAFELQYVSKSFGSVHALEGINLQAEAGRIFGLLGPNGAGKTTIVNILSTLMKPTSGNAKVFGKDVISDQDGVRELIGLAGQYAAVDEFLTGRENIEMVGNLYHLPKAEARKRTNQLLEQLSLTEAADRQVKTYSGGMRRRLDLGASLVGQPKILFLDEPTTGLDPKTRLELWAIIKQLVASGTSILLTTQYLEEADELADTIAIIDHGVVIAEGTSAQLKKGLGGDVIELEIGKQADTSLALKALTFGDNKPVFHSETNSITIPTKDGARLLSDVVRKLDAKHIDIKKLSLHQPSLDDVFLSLTGQPTNPDDSSPKAHRKKGSTQ